MLPSNRAGLAPLVFERSRADFLQLLAGPGLAAVGGPEPAAVSGGDGGVGEIDRLDGDEIDGFRGDGAAPSNAVGAYQHGAPASDDPAGGGRRRRAGNEVFSHAARELSPGGAAVGRTLDRSGRTGAPPDRSIRRDDLGRRNRGSFERGRLRRDGLTLGLDSHGIP